MTDIRTTLSSLTAAITIAALVGAANAATISVLDSGSATKGGWTSGTVTFTDANFGGIDLTGASKLVVTFGNRHSSFGASRVVNSVTYGGQTMTEAVGLGGDTSVYQSAIWYLDNPTTAGDLVLKTANSYGMGATIMVLGGTAAGHGATGESSGASTSLVTTAANSMVIASTIVDGTVPGLSAPAAQAPQTAGPSPVINYNSGNDSAIGTGYQTVASLESVSPAFDAGQTTVAAEFLAVPEPASLALIGLGGLMMIRRRR